MRILVSGSISSSLLNFRGPLLAEMRAAGHEVYACAGEPEERVIRRLEELGIPFHPLELRRAALTPLQDFGYYRALRSLLRTIRPDLCLSYTLKPVVFGSLAARSAGVRAASMITGAGASVPLDGSLRSRVISRIVRSLLRVSLPANEVVFFLNPDDQREFIADGLVPPDRTVVIPGTGVDLDYYRFTPTPPPPVTFLLIGRMMTEKGVLEYVDAARQVGRASGARFQLLGPLETGRRAIPLSQLEAWSNEGIVEYLGAVDDVRPHLATCSVFVLPSYREGLPRSVVEALATGRPVITTDVPGCRETVVSGVNGFLVPPRDASALAVAMRRFIDDPTLIPRMGTASRDLAERRYCVHEVNRRILEALRVPHTPTVLHGSPSDTASPSPPDR